MRTEHSVLAQKQNGFALIEVLVSAALFTIGILGLVALQARGIQFSSDAEDRTTAALLANDFASTMWTKGTVDTSDAKLSADYLAWQQRVQSVPPNCLNCLPDGKGSVTPNVDPVSGTKYATIMVTWQAPNQTSASRFVTEVVIP